MTLAPYVEVAEHALAVLRDSLTAYTDPDDEGSCARVVVTGGSVAAGYVDVSVLRPGRNGRLAREDFRVGVTISQIPAQVGLEEIKRGERG